MTHYICWGLEDLQQIWRLRTTCSSRIRMPKRDTPNAIRSVKRMLITKKNSFAKNRNRNRPKINFFTFWKKPPGSWGPPWVPGGPVGHLLHENEALGGIHLQKNLLNGSTKTLLYDQESLFNQTHIFKCFFVLFLYFLCNIDS